MLFRSPHLLLPVSFPTITPPDEPPPTTTSLYLPQAPPPRPLFPQRILPHPTSPPLDRISTYLRTSRRTSFPSSIPSQAPDPGEVEEHRRTSFPFPGPRRPSPRLDLQRPGRPAVGHATLPLPSNFWGANDPARYPAVGIGGGGRRRSPAGSLSTNIRRPPPRSGVPSSTPLLSHVATSTEPPSTHLIGPSGRRPPRHLDGPPPLLTLLHGRLRTVTISNARFQQKEPGECLSLTTVAFPTKGLAVYRTFFVYFSRLLLLI